MTDHATESALRAQIRELETALETERASVAILRGADETAEALAADLVKATERIAELEGRHHVTIDHDAQPALATGEVPATGTATVMVGVWPTCPLGICGFCTREADGQCREYLAPEHYTDLNGDGDWCSAFDWRRDR